MLLTFFVLWPGDGYDVSAYGEYFVRWFLPRISIVLLLQFVGFLFLRLYISNELDLKHNKNKITNVEAKIMAYAMSKEFGSDLVKLVVDKMSSTERNFIIKSGEKTIAIENDSQYNDLRNLIEKLADKIPNRNET